MTFSPVIVTTTFWSWIMSLVTTLGNFTLMLDWNVNDEANKKKTSSKKKQSIIAATWIGRKPYSSLLLLLNFMHCTPFDHLANKISQLGRRPLDRKKKQLILGARWLGRKPYSSLLLLLNFMHCTPFDHLANKISQLGRRP